MHLLPTTHLGSFIVRHQGGEGWHQEKHRLVEKKRDFCLVEPTTLAKWAKQTRFQGPLPEIGFVHDDETIQQDVQNLVHPPNTWSPLLDTLATWPLKNRPTHIEITESEVDWVKLVETLPNVQSLRILLPAESKHWDWLDDYGANWPKKWAATLTELQIGQNAAAHTLWSMARNFWTVAQSLVQLTQLRVLQLNRRCPLAVLHRDVGHLVHLQCLSVLITEWESAGPDGWIALNKAWPDLIDVDFVAWNVMCQYVDWEDDVSSPAEIHAPTACLKPMEQFVQAHRHLTRMRWAVSMDEPDEKDDVSMQRFPLTHLNVHHADTDTLVAIVRAHPKLEQLNVVSSAVTGDFLDALDLGQTAPTAATTERGRRLRPLAALRFHHCPRWIATELHVHVLVQTCPDMRMFVLHLAMEHAAVESKLTGFDVQTMVQKWPSLELLDLVGALTDSGNRQVRDTIEQRVHDKGQSIRYRMDHLRNFAMDKKPDERVPATVFNMLHDLWAQTPLGLDAPAAP